ncbi:MAG: STAS domain-containing protein [Spirochaetia bacterium]|nr:STAS domain-containing protein [Spirochaetia bacterium]
MASLFQVQSTIEKETPVIRLSGEITAEVEEELLQCYSTIPGEKKERVILDFDETRYINSSGIAILIGLITKATDNKQRVEFCGLNPHFRKVMDIVGLTDFVLIHDNLAEALKH